MKIFYMGLESYQARYTYQLTDWTKRAYDKRGVKYEIIPGDTIDDSEAIVTGQVLDAHGRSYFGMSQMMNLVKKLKAGEIITIKPGTIHEFKGLAKNGTVIEELSTRHIKNDSFYLDGKINKNENRKSKISLKW